MTRGPLVASCASFSSFTLAAPIRIMSQQYYHFPNNNALPFCHCSSAKDSFSSILISKRQAGDNAFLRQFSTISGGWKQRRRRGAPTPAFMLGNTTHIFNQGQHYAMGMRQNKSQMMRGVSTREGYFHQEEDGKTEKQQTGHTASSAAPSDDEPFTKVYVKYNDFLTEHPRVKSSASSEAAATLTEGSQHSLVRDLWQVKLIPKASNSERQHTTGQFSCSPEDVKNTSSISTRHILPNSEEQTWSQEHSNSPIQQSLEASTNIPLSSSFICLMLNRPIAHPDSKQLFASVWNNSTVRVCVDGAYQHFLKLNLKTKPHWICGDMDSVNWKDQPRPTEAEFATDNPVHPDDGYHTRWRRDPDQNTNDLQKAFKFLREDHEENFNVIIWGSGGRMDHEMTNLNTMYIETQRSPLNRRIMIIGEENMMEVLSPGVHEIHPNREIESGTCGLIPLTNATCVTTSGLQWDLHNDKMEFGGLVSSSNEIVKDTVRVETSAPVLWVSVLKRGMLH